MTALDRRQVLKGAAWSVPVIAVAVATPQAAASTVPDEPIICGGTTGNNGTYVVTGNVIVVNYATAPDIYEANVQLADGTRLSFGTNYGTAPQKGSLTWTIALPAKPTWVQIHGFNAHLGQEC